MTKLHLKSFILKPGRMLNMMQQGAHKNRSKSKPKTYKLSQQPSAELVKLVVTKDVEMEN